MRAAIAGCMAFMFGASLAAAQTSAPTREQPTSFAELEAGIQAYKAGQVESSITHFEKAIAADPTLAKARLYLAHAYSNKFVPGIDTDENNRIADLAIEQFEKAATLATEKETKLRALKGSASINFNRKRFGEAKDYHQKVIDLDPHDADAYYSIAVIDWSESYQRRAKLMNKLRLRAGQPITDVKACEELRARNLGLIEEGIEMLDKVLQLRKDHDDAMAYMNLLWREKANIECGDSQRRKADEKIADEWLEKTMALKRLKSQK